MTIHDVAFCAVPGENRTKGLIPFLLYRISAARARRIVTVSGCSKNDIVRHLHIPDSKIDVVPNACDQMFRPGNRSAAQVTVNARFGIRNRFVLAVPGTLSPRKGIFQLLDAFALLPDPLRQQYQLVVVAKKTEPSHTDFMAQAAARSIAANVTVTGYISRDELLAMYHATDLFVYPSQYEGFGLPPLEAMACGTPVVASNTSSVPEVVADAGLLVNPLDAAAISAAMAAVLSNERLRADLRQKGLQRAAQFSWDKAAAALLDIFRSVAHSK